MKGWKRVLAFTFLFLFSCGEREKGFIQTKGRWFVDEDQRILILRGINFSDRSKRPPFTPQVPYEDIDKLKEWGFNSVRFLIIWEAIEPEEGFFDYQYIGEVKFLITNTLEK